MSTKDFEKCRDCNGTGSRSVMQPVKRDPSTPFNTNVLPQLQKALIECSTCLGERVVAKVIPHG